MKKNRIKNEIDRIEIKQAATIVGTIGTLIFGSILKFVCGLILFFVANYFYFKDDLFYMDVDTFAYNVSNKFSTVGMIICAIAAFKFYGYYKEKRALKRVLKRRKRRVAR